MINSNQAENRASFSLFNQGTISTAAADAANAASNPELTSFGIVGGPIAPDVIGLGRIAAINAINELGLTYLLTYTAGDANNNDTVASADVVDGVVYLVVYQFTAAALNQFAGYGYTMSSPRLYEIYFTSGQTVPANNSFIRIVGSPLTQYNQVFLVRDPQSTSNNYFTPAGFTTAMELVPTEFSLNGYGYGSGWTAQGWEQVNVDVRTADLFVVEPLSPGGYAPAIYTQNGNAYPSPGKVVTLVGAEVQGMSPGMYDNYSGQYYVEGGYGSWSPLSPSFYGVRTGLKSLKGNQNYWSFGYNNSTKWFVSPDDYSWSFNGDYMAADSQDLDAFWISGDVNTNTLTLSLRAGAMNSNGWSAYYKLMGNDIKPSSNGYAGKQIEFTQVEKMYSSPPLANVSGIFNVISSAQYVGFDGMSDTYNIDVVIQVTNEIASLFNPAQWGGNSIRGSITLIP